MTTIRIPRLRFYPQADHARVINAFNALYCIVFYELGLREKSHISTFSYIFSSRLQIQSLLYVVISNSDVTQQVRALLGNGNAVWLAACGCPRRRRTAADTT